MKSDIDEFCLNNCLKKTKNKYNYLFIIYFIIVVVFFFLFLLI